MRLPGMQLRTNSAPSGIENFGASENFFENDLKNFDNYT